jgi:hypothetical protein
LLVKQKEVRKNVLEYKRQYLKLFEQWTTCITPIGICHNSYYSFLNFKNVDTVIGVAPEYNTAHNGVEIGEINHSQYLRESKNC